MSNIISAQLCMFARSPSSWIKRSKSATPRGAREKSPPFLPLHRFILQGEEALNQGCLSKRGKTFLRQRVVCDIEILFTENSSRHTFIGDRTSSFTQ